MRAPPIAIAATLLLSSRIADAQFAIDSEIEIDTPALRPDGGVPASREHDLHLTAVGTTVFASWLDDRNDPAEDIQFVRLSRDGHPIDTMARTVPSSQSAWRVRTAGGGGTFLVTWLYASQFDSGSTSARAFRLGEDASSAEGLFAIGLAALEFNHGFVDDGVAWDGDAFVTAAVEARAVTATSYSEGRRIPPSGDPTQLAAPNPQSVFAMASTGSSAIYAYDEFDRSTVSSRAFFVSVAGVATRVLDVLPSAIGIAARDSEFIVAVSGHTWQFADDGRLLRHTPAAVPTATELAMAAGGDGYVLAWSVRGATSEWEIRVSRLTRDGDLAEPEGIPLVTALRDEPHPVLCATADGGLLLGYERYDDGPLYETSRVRVRRFASIAPLTGSTTGDAGSADVADAADDVVDDAAITPRRSGCGCRTTASQSAVVAWLAVIAILMVHRRRRTTRARIHPRDTMSSPLADFHRVFAARFACRGLQPAESRVPRAGG